MPAAPRTPSGSPLENGYQTVITFAEDATVALFEKSVQPMGLEGGEKIDVTTMHNVDVRTYAARFLKEVTDSQMTVAYDPAVLTALYLMINKVQKVTLTFPDGSTWNFDGYLRNFQPSSIEIGAQPMATCTIVATNRDATTGVEASPSFAAAP